MYKVGDLTFYPTLGVGKIERIESRTVGKTECKYYVIQILDRKDRVMVPVANVESVGLRPLMAKNSVAEVYDILEEPSTIGAFRTWNQRFREYTLKLKTGDPFEIARVLRDLVVLSQEKDLSFGERKMLDQARKLLVKEIAMITRDKEQQVSDDVHTRIRSAAGLQV